MPKLTYRHTLYAGYLGYITQAIMNNLTPLLFLIFRDSFGIPLEKITLLITFNFFVQLFVDFLAAKFADRIGYRKCIVCAHIFSAAGLVGLAVFPHLFSDAFAGLAAAVILYAVGGGLIEVLISPIVEACPTPNKAAAMSLLHSFYCWGTVLVILLSTLSLTLFGKASWRLLACLWAVVPAANALLFARVPIATLTPTHEGMALRELFSMKLFWLFVALMVTAGACEQAMSQGASAFAESGLGVSKAAGDLAGPCLFAALMGLARVFYAKYSERVRLLPFMIGSGALCIGSYLLAALAPVPLLSLAGCALCGLSVGILWPGVFSIAAAQCPRGGTALFALLALAGDLGCAGGPTAVGLVAGVHGDDLKAGLLAAAAFPAVLTLCSVLLQRRIRPQRQSGPGVKVRP